jgi:small subunit ribosomal protein S6
LSKYELTYILRPVEEATLTVNGERITKLVQNAGGEIVHRSDWGRRRLAFPIRKNNDGYYTTLYIALPGTAVRGLERSLKLMDDVLRYLVVNVETHTIPAAPAPAAEPATAPVAEAPAPLVSRGEAAPAAETGQPQAEMAALVGDAPVSAETAAAPESVPAATAEGS